MLAAIANSILKTVRRETKRRTGGYQKSTRMTSCLSWAYTETKGQLYLAFELSAFIDSTTRRGELSLIWKYTMQIITKCTHSIIFRQIAAARIATGVAVIIAVADHRVHKARAVRQVLRESRGFKARQAHRPSGHSGGDRSHGLSGASEIGRASCRERV